MRVDFYQLSRDPAEGVVPLLARNTLKAGERLLVVSGDDAQRGRIGDALWAAKADFLANGQADGVHDARQPILISAGLAPANGARFLALADGVWRDADTDFARVFYLFDDTTVQGARDCWRTLGQREGIERYFWKQQDGRWAEGP